MKPIALALSALVLGVGGVAALDAQSAPPSKPGLVDVSRVTAGTYTTDGSHSLVAWSVDHFGFNDYFGLFGDVDGTLTIDPANPSAAAVDVTIPITSLAVVSEGLRDHMLRPGKDGAEPDFFGPEPEPARFVSRAVRIGASGVTAEVDGDLTLNGVTRPVELYVSFTGAGKNPMNQRETIGFEGRTTIQRSAFGIDYGLPMVGDAVELEITAAFEKE